MRRSGWRGSSGDSFPTVITHAQIESADALPDDFGGWLIQIALTPDGAAALGSFSEANIGSGLAIVLDGVVLSVPVIQTRVTSPLVITGNFTEVQAQTLAAQMVSEPLPIPLEIVSLSVMAN